MYYDARGASFGPADQHGFHPLSRAVHIDANMQVVIDCCDKHAIGISVIEPLQSGGTRVVLNNSDGAASLRIRMKKNLILGPVTRSGLYMRRAPLPYR